MYTAYITILVHITKYFKLYQFLVSFFVNITLSLAYFYYFSPVISAEVIKLIVDDKPVKFTEDVDNHIPSFNDPRWVHYELGVSFYHPEPIGQIEQVQPVQPPINSEVTSELVMEEIRYHQQFYDTRFHRNVPYSPALAAWAQSSHFTESNTQEAQQAAQVPHVPQQTEVAQLPEVAPVPPQLHQEHPFTSGLIIGAQVIKHLHQENPFTQLPNIPHADPVPEVAPLPEVPQVPQENPVTHQTPPNPLPPIHQTIHFHYGQFGSLENMIHYVDRIHTDILSTVHNLNNRLPFNLFRTMALNMINPDKNMWIANTFHDSNNSGHAYNQLRMILAELIKTCKEHDLSQSAEIECYYHIGAAVMTLNILNVLEHAPNVPHDTFTRAFCEKLYLDNYNSYKEL